MVPAAVIGGRLLWRQCLRWCRVWTRSCGVWAIRTRRWSGTGAAGAGWRGSSLPVASRSFPWTRRWPGSMRRAASSIRSGRTRSNRTISICSGSPRCSAITRCMGRCCDATPVPWTSWTGMVPMRSSGSRRGCGPLPAPHRPCERMGRWPRNLSRSRAPMAGWPGAMPGQSGRSWPRWPDTRL
jgi:hypothetical protein